MEINALLMDEKDNVVTCVTEVAAGKGQEFCTVKAEENIPYCHKVALVDLKKGDEVIKYGESLGVMTEDAAKGHWVSHNNLVSVPRDYDSEMVQE
mgnify:FL=1